MRIVCISDTHNKHRALDLPAGDVLVHAGDATMNGTIEEFAAFGNWFAKQPYAYKLFIPGNHDFICQSEPSMAREMLGEFTVRGVRMLVDERCNIVYRNKDGTLDREVKFYGSPWVPNLEGWAYYGDHTTLCDRFGGIPVDTNVLITHTPPANVLASAMGVHFGSTELQQRVSELGGQLKAHVFGHIHDSYGTHLNGHTSINACNCDEDYELTNAPIVIEL